MTRTVLSVILAGATAMLYGGDDLFGTSVTPSAMLVFSDDASIDSVPATLLSPAGDIPPLVVPRDRDGLFYVTARVNGVPVRFLFDTGASQTVLTARDARRIGIDHAAGRDGVLITASGTITTKTAHIDRIEVANHRIEDSEAMVVGDALPVSLLGQNVLARMGSVTVHPDSLYFH